MYTLSFLDTTVQESLEWLERNNNGGLSPDTLHH